jgi:hypothetical protein
MNKMPQKCVFTHVFVSLQLYRRASTKSGLEGFHNVGKRINSEKSPFDQTPTVPSSRTPSLPNGQSTPSNQQQTNLQQSTNTSKQTQKKKAVPMGMLYQEKPTPKSPFSDEQLPFPMELPPEASIATTPISPKSAEILSQPVQRQDLWINPENGWVYMKEHVYHNRLNKAFPQGWKLVPTGSFTIYGTHLSRPYSLIVEDRWMSMARGEFSAALLPPNPAHDERVNKECEYTALVRCCKDIGVASELWDPVWLRTVFREWTEKKWDKVFNKYTLKIIPE